MEFLQVIFIVTIYYYYVSKWILGIELREDIYIILGYRFVNFIIICTFPDSFWRITTRTLRDFFDMRDCTMVCISPIVGTRCILHAKTLQRYFGIPGTLDRV